MAPHRSTSASCVETKMVVGPSAEPMMPMAPAFSILQPRKSAAIRAANIPNWAAAPRSTVTGLWSMGVKSVSAPTPRNIRRGKSSLSSPAFLSSPKNPSSSAMPVDGRLASKTPKPMAREAEARTVWTHPSRPSPEQCISSRRCRGLCLGTLPGAPETWTSSSRFPWGCMRSVIDGRTTAPCVPVYPEVLPSLCDPSCSVQTG